MCPQLSGEGGGLGLSFWSLGSSLDTHLPLSGSLSCDENGKKEPQAGEMGSKLLIFSHIDLSMCHLEGKTSKDFQYFSNIDFCVCLIQTGHKPVKRSHLGSSGVHLGLILEHPDRLRGL